MYYRLIFFMVPSLVYGGIEVSVKASKSEPGAKIEITGSDSNVIEENERQLFQISDRQLKKLIANISHHKPDDVFVRSPTPWNDLYETYDWDQVETYIFAKQARLLNRSDERVNITIQAIINNSSSNVTFKTEMTGNILNSVTTKWNVIKKETRTEDIFYDIAFVGGDEDDVSKLSFASTWGVEKSQSQPLVVGSGFDVTTIELEPSSALVTTLTATRSTLDIAIEYISTLRGDVAYNYAKKYKGHHFWRTPINKLLLDSGLPLEHNFQEIVTMKFYYDAVFVVRDTRLGVTLLTLPIALHQSNFYNS